jgi:hypothetical protein
MTKSSRPAPKPSTHTYRLSKLLKSRAAQQTLISSNEEVRIVQTKITQSRGFLKHCRAKVVMSPFAKIQMSLFIVFVGGRDEGVAVDDERH